MSHPIKSILIALLCAFIITPAFAKRMAPVEAAPIEQNGYRYTQTYEWDKNKGGTVSRSLIITCTQTQTNTVMWKTTLYETVKNPDLEGDVQDVWLKSMELKGSEIEAIDEKGVVYRIDTKTGKVKR